MNSCGAVLLSILILFGICKVTKGQDTKIPISSKNESYIAVNFHLPSPVVSNRVRSIITLAPIVVPVVEEVKPERKVTARETRPEERYSPAKEYDSKVEIVRDDYTNNCVAWAKKVTGIDRPLGAGARKGIQGTTPAVGAIVVERSIIHALVSETVLDTGVIALESNYIKGHITRRFIPNSDILGYIYN